MALTAEEEAELNALEKRDALTKRPSVGHKILGAAAKVPEFLGGAAAGVTEAVNPLNIPHNLETLARVPFQEGGLLKKLKSASEQPHVFGDVSLRNIAIGARAVPKAIFTDTSLLKAIKEEEDTQAAAEEGSYGWGETAGEVGAGLYGMVQLAKSLPKLAKTVSKTAVNISTKLKQAQSAKNLLDTQKALSEVLGDVSPEVGKAIVERTGQVKKLLEGPESGRSLFPLVKKLRQHVEDTKKFIGPMVGAYRDLVFSSTKNKLSTAPLVGMIDDLQAAKTLEDATSTLAPSDLAKVQKVREMLGGIGKQEINPKDALLVTDMIDDWLAPVFGGTNRGGVASAGEYVLSGVRTALKDKLHTMFPKYAAVDAEYSAFKDAESLVGSRLDGMNAESVVSGLFGKNKTELKEAIDSLMNRAKQTQKTISSLSKDIKIIPEPTNLAQTTRNSANVIAQDLSRLASESKIPSSKEFFDEAANILGARRIKETTSSGWGDMVADKIRAIVDRYAHEGELAGRAKGQKIGGIAGAIGGSLVGAPGGGLVSAVSGGGAGTLGAKILGNIYAAKGYAEGMKKGEAATNIPALLDRLVEIRGAVPEESKTIIDNVTYVYKALGPEVAARLLYMVPVTPAATAISDAIAKGKMK